MLLDVPFKALSSVAPLRSISDPPNIIQENKRGASNAVERLPPLELNITRTASIMKHNYSGAAKSNASSSVSLAGFLFLDFSWGGNLQWVWEFFFSYYFSPPYSQRLLWLRLFFSRREIYKNMPCASPETSCARVPRRGLFSTHAAEAEPIVASGVYFSLVAEEFFRVAMAARVADATGPGVEMVK